MIIVRINIIVVIIRVIIYGFSEFVFLFSIGGF